MTATRIVLRLDPAIDFEREFAERYQATPRSRRQEWTRNVLRAGLACAERPVPAPTLPAPPPVPAARATVLKGFLD